MGSLVFKNSDGIVWNSSIEGLPDHGELTNNYAGNFLVTISND